MARPATTGGVAPRRPAWRSAVAGLLAGVAGLGLAIVTVAAAEHLLVGGETRQWCEGKKGYESNHGPLERCVRERQDANLVASDRHRIELYREDSGGDRYEARPWPLTGADVDVEFEANSVTVTDGHGVAVTYPNSLYEDTR